eukprot:TRINITY_DN9721_c0_g1_i13.p1 TRINITY_DN9721_c0_g1~~TRINITY_DN9721_c0_g1_i13.p1  ORF type:complete len:253 (-),score=39.57 TRINITY_DN9721_c0_g1_i13:558-1316(-)
MCIRDRDFVHRHPDRDNRAGQFGVVVAARWLVQVPTFRIATISLASMWTVMALTCVDLGLDLGPVLFYVAVSLLLGAGRLYAGTRRRPGDHEVLEFPHKNALDSVLEIDRDTCDIIPNPICDDCESPNEPDPGPLCEDNRGVGQPLKFRYLKRPEQVRELVREDRNRKFWGRRRKGAAQKTVQESAAATCGFDSDVSTQCSKSLDLTDLSTCTPELTERRNCSFWERWAESGRRAGNNVGREPPVDDHILQL